MENLNWGSQPDLWKDIPDNILFELSSGLEYQNPSWEHFWEKRMETEPSGLPNVFFSSQDEKLTKSVELAAPLVPIVLTSSEVLPVAQDSPPIQSKVRGEITPRKEKKHKSMEAKAIVWTSETSMSEGKLECTEVVSTKAQDTIANLTLQCKNQQMQLEELKTKQERATTKEEVATLTKEYLLLEEKIGSYIDELIILQQTIVLTAFEVFDVMHLNSVLQQQKAQISLNQKELKAIGSESVRAYYLLLTEQPYAPVVFKGRIVDSPYSLSLLMGPKTSSEKPTTIEVTAKVANQENTKNPVTLENAVERYDFTKKQVVFADIKVSASTRMAPISIVFTAKEKQRGKSANSETLAESVLTSALIVITNESQWCDAASKLFQLELFSLKNEAPWCQFANELHRNILRATNQDIISQCNRGFAAWEFQYIHKTHFGGRQIVKKDEVIPFWQWFGHVLTSIRFKRHVKEMWKKGLIFGMISKKACHDYLAKAESGSFIIRFSDSSPGSFAIAYTEDTKDKEKDRVKHYLVKSEDLGTNKTLPDFLKEKSTFKHLGMVNVKEGTLAFVDKDAELGAYYGKRKMTEQTNKGYVQNLESES